MIVGFMIHETDDVTTCMWESGWLGSWFGDGAPVWSFGQQILLSIV